jgi:integrase
MPVPRTALTDRFVAHAKATSTQTDFFDEGSPGLALRISAGGRKAWSLIFTSPRDGKRARMTLGTYPATSLAEARTRAIEARGHAEAGKDPRDVFAAEAAGAMSVKDLLDSYLEKHVRPNLRAAAEVERRLNRNVIPVIGSLRLADLHRRDLNRVIDPLIARVVPTEANRVFEDVRAALRWGVARGDLDHSPAEGMRKPAAVTIRERVLSDEELRIWWTTLPGVLARSKACQRILKLCLVTAQRVGEVAGMRRSELDLPARLWSLPGSRTKNKFPHTVPLSDMAIELIEEALKDAGEKSKWVFPAGEESHLEAQAVARTVSRAQAKTKEHPNGRFTIDHWTAHGLRRTALTGMGRLGVPPIVSGHVANHRGTTKAGITLQVYAQYTYDSEKRSALDLWAERVTALVGGDAAKILPLGKR